MNWLVLSLSMVTPPADTVTTLTSFRHSRVIQNPTAEPRSVRTGIAQTSGRLAAMRSGPGASPARESSHSTKGPTANAAPKPTTAPATQKPTIHRLGIVMVVSFSVMRLCSLLRARGEIAQDGALKFRQRRVAWPGVQVGRIDNRLQPGRRLDRIKSRVDVSLRDAARDQRSQAAGEHFGGAHHHGDESGIVLDPPQQLNDHSRSARISSVPGEFAEHIKDRRNRLLGISVPCDQRLRHRQIALEDRPEQCRLVGEVVEDARLADPDRPSDVSHARALIPLRGEQPASFDGDLLPLPRDPLRIDSSCRHAYPN